jgi:hypothetical protein
MPILEGFVGDGGGREGKGIIGLEGGQKRNLSFARSLACCRRAQPKLKTVSVRNITMTKIHGNISQLIYAVIIIPLIDLEPLFIYFLCGAIYSLIILFLSASISIVSS